MKTQNKLNIYSEIIRLQEIIVWIIGILVFLCLIYSYNLIAQENETYNQDTILLKTEITPPNSLLSESPILMLSSNSGKTIMYGINN